MEDGFAMGYALGQDSGSNSGGNCNDGAFGGANSWIWIIVVFALLFGWGNNGNQRGNGSSSGGDGAMAAYIPYLASAVNTNGAVTRADLCSEFAFNDLNRAVEGLNNGLCNGFYTLSGQVNSGFAGVNNAICSLGYNNAQLANGITMAMMQNQNATQSQISDCCCKLERGLDTINYNMATNTCALQTSMANNTRDIIDATNSGTRAILDYLCQEKISTLQSENQTLKFAASQQAQNTYLTNFITAQNQMLRSEVAPTPVPSYQVPAPYPYCVGNTQSYGCNGCGNC